MQRSHDGSFLSLSFSRVSEDFISLSRFKKFDGLSKSARCNARGYTVQRMRVKKSESEREKKKAAHRARVYNVRGAELERVEYTHHGVAARARRERTERERSMQQVAHKAPARPLIYDERVHFRLTDGWLRWIAVRFSLFILLFSSVCRESVDRFARNTATPPLPPTRASNRQPEMLSRIKSVPGRCIVIMVHTRTRALFFPPLCFVLSFFQLGKEQRAHTAAKARELFVRSIRLWMHSRVMDRSGE